MRDGTTGTANRDRLHGRRVLITRSQPLAGRLASAIHAAGGAAIVFPTIEILAPPDLAAVQSLLGRLEQFDFAVFISPNAVLRATGLRAGPWPAGVRAAAVGAGTAVALRAAGIDAVIVPPLGGDSEALAALPEFRELSGRSIVIFRGVGGREWLRDTFAARGARVEYAECYVRGMPQQGAGALVNEWRGGGMHAVVVSSGEGLANLFSLLGADNHGLMRGVPVFVPHPRIAQAAKAAGVTNAIVTEPGDSEIVAGLQAYFGGS